MLKYFFWVLSMLRRTTFYFLFFLLSFAFPVSSEAEESPGTPAVWTLPEAVRFAVANNPDARMAMSRIEAAQAAITAEKASFYPQLSLESGYSQTDNPMYSFGNILNQGAFSPGINFNDPGRTDDLNVGVRLGYRLYNGGRDLAGLRAATAQESASRWDFGAVQAQLAFEVVRVFNQMVEAEDMIKAHQAALDAITASLAVARARFEEGVLLKADLLDLEVQEAKYQEDLIHARHALDLAQTGFRNLLGLQAGAVAIEADSGRDQEVPAPTTDFEGRDEVKSADAMIRAAEAQVRQARAGYYPALDSYAGYTSEKGWETGGSGDSWQAGVKLSYNLFDGRRTSAEVARSTAMLAQAREQKRKALLAVGLEVQQAELALKEAEARLQVAEKSVGQAEESARINRARFQEGVVLASDLIAVETRLTDARVRRAVAESSRRVAVAALRRAEGLPQFPGSSPQAR